MSGFSGFPGCHFSAGAGTAGFAACCRTADDAAASGFSAAMGGVFSGTLAAAAVLRSGLDAGPRSVMLSSFTRHCPPMPAAPLAAPTASAAGRAFSVTPATAAGFSAGLGAGGFVSAGGLAGGMSMTSWASGMKTTLSAAMREESVMLLISASSWRSTL